MPNRVEYFGSAAQMPPDELPTVRDVICQAKYYQETLPGKSHYVYFPPKSQFLLPPNFFSMIGLKMVWYGCGNIEK